MGAFSKLVCLMAERQFMFFFKKQRFICFHGKKKGEYMTTRKKETLKRRHLYQQNCYLKQRHQLIHFAIAASLVKPFYMLSNNQSADKSIVIQELCNAYIMFYIS